jgi:DNA-damage-inducible protein J
MSTTEQVNVRIAADLKAEAEAILSRIGLGPSDAIRMFYHQIVIHHGLPFEAKAARPAKSKSMDDVMDDFIARNKQTLDILKNS